MINEVTKNKDTFNQQNRVTSVRQTVWFGYNQSVWLLRQMLHGNYYSKMGVTEQAERK
jgi:hypothetical protein